MFVDSKKRDEDQTILAARRHQRVKRSRGELGFPFERLAIVERGGTLRQTPRSETSRGPVDQQGDLGSTRPRFQNFDPGGGARFAEAQSDGFDSGSRQFLEFVDDPGIGFEASQAIVAFLIWSCGFWRRSTTPLTRPFGATPIHADETWLSFVD